MRTGVGYVAGLAGFHLVLTLLGLALLVAAGFVARPRRGALVPALAALGPAFLTGAVAYALVALPAILLGVPLRVPWMCLLVAILIALAVVFARRRPLAVEPAGPPDRAGRRALLVLALPVLLIALVGLYSYANVGVGWDASHVWTLRGSALASTGTLAPEVFDNPLLNWVHPDYPLLQPLLQGTLFDALGVLDVRIWQGELWLWALAGVWTIAWLLGAGRARMACIALAVFAPALAVAGLNSNVELGDADVTNAMLLAIGTTGGAVWLQTGSRRHLALATLFLAGAANTKNEGLLFSVLVVAALVVLTLLRRLPGGWRAVLVALVAFVVLVAPWRIWVQLHGFRATDVTPLSEAVRELLGIRPEPRDRGAQLTFARSVVAGFLTDGTWGLIAGPFLGFAVAALTLRRTRIVAALYLVGFVATLAGMLWVYWSTNQVDWTGHIQRTSIRLVGAPVLIASAGAAHLAVLAFSELWPGLIGRRPREAEAARAPPSGT